MQAHKIVFNILFKITFLFHVCFGVLAKNRIQVVSLTAKPEEPADQATYLQELFCDFNTMHSPASRNPSTASASESSGFFFTIWT